MNATRDFFITVVLMLTVIAAALYPPTKRLNDLEARIDSIVATKDSVINNQLRIINYKDSVFRAHMNECTFFSNNTIELDKNRYIRLKSDFSLLRDYTD